METSNLVNDCIDELVSIRRVLHQNPELSNREFKTTRLVEEKLREYGAEIEQLGLKTGTVALIRGEGRKTPGRTVAIRAELDALPMTELSGLPFASLNDGVCHSCGHDVHTAILLICARILCGIRQELNGNVILLFQPAEENGTGAKELIDAGFCDVLQPDVFVGLHTAPDISAGYIGIKSGAANASADEFSVRITGKGGHGARPEECIDPIMISAMVITQLQMIIARENTPLSPAVLTIGSIHGGASANVIPDSVVLQGTLRSLSPETRTRLKKAAERIIIGTAAAHRGSAEIIWAGDGIPPLVNDETVTDQIALSAEKAIGREKIIYLKQPSMGSEDFSVLFPRYAPGVHFKLGTGNDTDPRTRESLHSPRIIFDEECLPTGAAVLLQFVRDYLS